MCMKVEYKASSYNPNNVFIALSLWGTTHPCLWLDPPIRQLPDWSRPRWANQWEDRKGIDCVMMLVRPAGDHVVTTPMIIPAPQPGSASLFAVTLFMSAQWLPCLLAHASSVLLPLTLSTLQIFLYPKHFLKQSSYNELEWLEVRRINCLQLWALTMHGAVVTSSKEGGCIKSEHLLRAGDGLVSFPHHAAAAAAAAGLYNDKLSDDEHLYNGLGGCHFK